LTAQEKDKVEVAVQVAQRWILARLRHERFFSLAELNARIRQLVDPLNAKVVLELFDDRHGVRSTILTSQLPVAQWHDFIGDPTLADSICDRLLHNAHRIGPKGPSRRKEGKLES
jgi:IstB-like ATP binding protein